MSELSVLPDTLPQGGLLAQQPVLTPCCKQVTHVGKARPSTHAAAAVSTQLTLLNFGGDVSPPAALGWFGGCCKIISLLI